MPSSPTPLPACPAAGDDLTGDDGLPQIAGLLEVLAGVPDPRARRGVRHQVASILAVSVAAVLAGARAYTVIAEWAAEQPAQVLAAFGIVGPVPSEATIRRVLAAVDAAVLAAAVGVFVWTRSTVAAGRRVVAVDGKSLRGAGSADGSMPHLVGALDHATGTVLGQLATTAKSNEIPTVRTLLATLDQTVGLGGVVVTIDAMHTQDDTARVILDGGGDYLMTVKANRPKLLALLKAMPWDKVRSHSATDTGRGRRITRSIKVLQAPTDLTGWTDFPGASQVAQIRRTRTAKTKTGAKKKTVEVVYVITSADHHAAPPRTLAAWVQHHWRIESLHWIRDVVFDEDRSQIRTGTGAETMATLRNIAISLLRLAGWTTIAAALRHHQRHPDKIITLLTR
jgi:predicted transposase YbfD/YdcC